MKRFFLYPVGDASNESIAKHPSLMQTEPLWNAECYVGRTKINLPLYEVENMAFKSLRESELSFYAFQQKSEGGKRQYFDSKNINGKAKENKILTYIAELVSKLPKNKK